MFCKWPEHDVTKFLVIKDPFKVQDRSVDFNITGYEKLIDTVLYCTLHITFK